MRLEDTIKNRLFRTFPTPYYRSNATDLDCVIECKAEPGKPIPLCIPGGAFINSDLVYRKLYWDGVPHYIERSTPRAMYNYIFATNYFPNAPLIKVKIKDSLYYAAPGVLFNIDKYPLFYFANEDRNGMSIPRLYITPVLLRDAACGPCKPMEKFFMSTIIPYLVSNRIRSVSGSFQDTIIEIDNNPDNTFFIPQGSLVSNTPVDKINDKLNDILFNGSNVLSRFVENYYSAPNTTRSSH